MNTRPNDAAIVQAAEIIASALRTLASANAAIGEAIARHLSTAVDQLGEELRDALASDETPSMPSGPAIDQGCGAVAGLIASNIKTSAGAAPNEAP